MSRLLDEHLVSLSDAPDCLPRRGGRRIHVSTLHRWAREGLRGRRLETVKIGAITFTSREALVRFSTPPEQPERPAPSARQRRAERRAAELGI